jgi:hypothetical protein
MLVRILDAVQAMPAQRSEVQSFIPGTPVFMCIGETIQGSSPCCRFGDIASESCSVLVGILHTRELIFECYTPRVIHPADDSAQDVLRHFLTYIKLNQYNIIKIQERFIVPLSIMYFMHS